jgi:hypothetical protein
VVFSIEFWLKAPNPGTEFKYYFTIKKFIKKLEII